MKLVEFAAYLSALLVLLIVLVVSARVVKRLVLGAGPVTLRMDPAQLREVVDAIKYKA